MLITSLKNQKEFDLVSKHGLIKHGSCFIVILSNDTSFLPKVKKNNVVYLGLKVSKKFSKKAVIRNKVRRQIKHLINLMVNNHKIDLCDKALIVIPKITIQDKKFAFFESDMRYILSRLVSFA